MQLMTIRPAVAEAEVNRIAHAVELSAFCDHLARYVHTGRGAEELGASAVALVARAHELDLLPERIIRAIHLVYSPRADQGLEEMDVQTALRRDARHTAAITELLCVYFDEPPVRGTPFRREPELSVTPPAASG
jgi:hypothetical protein